MKKKRNKEGIKKSQHMIFSLALALMLPTSPVYADYASPKSSQLDKYDGTAITPITSDKKQSVAYGLSITVGAQAAALGNNINASGYGAVAVGGDDANGVMYAGYKGDNTFSSGGYRYLTSNATGTIALGAEAWAGGTSQYSNGQSTGDAGQFAVAVGSRASAYGYSSLALGGHSTASGSNALAMMALSAARGERSIALGVAAEADGSDSISFGYRNKTLANYSMALGALSTVSGEDSISVGIGDN